MSIGITKIASELESSLVIDFYFNNSHIYTVGQRIYDKWFPHEEMEVPDFIAGDIKIPPRKKRKSEYGYLVIDYTYDLNSYDSLLQGSAKARPDLIISHGIICFLTGIPIISFQFHSSFSNLTKSHLIKPKDHKAKLVCDGRSSTKDLQKLLQIIEKAESDRKSLIFSLLDRWRKAVYLEVESEESYVHNDESILACFHIWELLAGQYSQKLKDKVRGKISVLIENILAEDFHLRPNQLAEEKPRLFNLIESAILPGLSIKSQIFYLFEMLNLYNPKSHALVERFVGHRNAIAHGRSDLYDSKALFPLKPFFSFVKEITDEVEPIKIATARTIATYLGLNAWKKEWDYLLKIEVPPFDKVKVFLKNKIQENLTAEDFQNGKIDEITPGVITYYYLKNKVKFNSLEEALKKFIHQFTLTEDNAVEVLYESIILADSKNTDLALKCQGFVSVIYKNNWHKIYNFRDILKELEYLDLTPQWYKSFLSKRK